MKHLYDNGDGELVAADSLETAAYFYDCTLAGEEEVSGDWFQVPDDQKVDIIIGEDSDTPTTKTAAEWAAGFEDVAIASSYYA